MGEYVNGDFCALQRQEKLVTPGAPPQCDPHSPEVVTPAGVAGIEWVSRVKIPVYFLVASGCPWVYPNGSVWGLQQALFRDGLLRISSVDQCVFLHIEEETGDLHSEVSLLLFKIVHYRL